VVPFFNFYAENNTVGEQGRIYDIWALYLYLCGQVGRLFLIFWENNTKKRLFLHNYKYLFNLPTGFCFMQEKYCAKKLIIVQNAEKRILSRKRRK
jgi:hypothetical protein